MVDKAKMKKVMKQFTPKRANIAQIGSEPLEIPNFNKGKAPESDRDLANKKYVDDNSFALPSLTAGSVLFSDGTTIAQDNSNFFWDDTNNRLGIGTATPGQKLDVIGTIRFNSNLINLSAGTIYSYDSGNAVNKFGDVGVNTRQLALYAGGAERIRIDNSGEVGIGTTNPDEDLHIYSTFPFIRLETSRSNNTGNAGITLFENGTKNWSIVSKGSDNSFRITSGAFETLRLIIESGGNVGIGIATPSLPLDVKAKSGMSAIGGFCIKLTNKTGGNTVQGQLVAVYSATAVNDAFKVAALNDDGVFGIVLEAGVADASEAWVVVSGIADVLIDAGGSAIGDRMISSGNTAGSADVWNTGGAVATHFLEIGHCIETRTGAGLARCVLHFN